jgi:hypothetical protein
MICRVCKGTGRVTERGRHYLDQSVRKTCLECFDQKAAEAEHDAFMARQQADRDEADRLMDEARDFDVIDG